MQCLNESENCIYAFGAHTTENLANHEFKFTLVTARGASLTDH